MKRRTFILFTSATVMASSGFVYLQTSNKDNLSGYIKSLSDLDELGEKYKNDHPEINYLSELENTIERYPQAATYNKKISLAIIEDFRNNHLCNIDGWQLSQTECLLAAAFVSFDNYIKPLIVTKQQNFQNASVENFLNITNWGPQKTLKNTVFNQQTDGHAGLWFAVDNPPPNLKVVIDGKNEITFTNESSITSGIHDLDELKLFLNKVGKSEVAIYDSINNRKQIIGYFEVLPIPEKLVYADGTKSEVFCPIENWGPKMAQRHMAFNIQPNGNAAIWIKTKCAPKMTKVLINNFPIKTTVSSGLVTASVPIKNIKTNNDNYEVKLFDKVTNESLLIGKIKIK